MQFLNVEKITKSTPTPEGADIPSSRDIVSRTVSVAWPSVLESFLMSLTGFVDTIMVGSLGVAAIAAVGITTQPKFIALCVFIAISVATSSVVARRRGEENRESANKILKMVILAAVVLTAIISTTFILGADFIISISGSAADTHGPAVEYFNILMMGLGFNAITLVINAAQRGVGNTKIAMRTNLVSNAVNVFFNYALIGGNFGFPELGIRGAAIATVIGGAVGCLMSIGSVLKKDSYLNLFYSRGLFGSRQDIKSMLNVGSSAFVEQLFLRIGFFLFQIAVASLGTTQLAAHQIGMNFMAISFSFADGLSVASVALVGRSLGEKRLDKAKLYSSACQKIGVICAFFVSIIFFFFGRQLFSMFSSEPVILDYGNMIMMVLCFVIYLQIEQVTIMGCLRGAGDTKYTAFVSLISVSIIRPGASWLLCYPLGLGLLGIWLGLCCDQLLRFILGFIRFKKGNWLKIKL